MNDSTNPDHYREHPAGIECIDVTRHASFPLGNALKYIWRTEWSEADRERKVENLKKAVWYLQDEIERLESLG